MDYRKLEKTSMCYRCKNKEICKIVYQTGDSGIQQANWNCSHFTEATPQGDLADEVWKLYTKYQSQLTAWVIEFGNELNDLSCKYQKGGKGE